LADAALADLIGRAAPRPSDLRTVATDLFGQPEVLAGRPTSRGPAPSRSSSF
jgi:hypothetical protein